MTPEQSPMLEFPAWLYGSTSALLRKVRAEGQGWAREYLKTGGFTQPRRMLQVPSGEVLVMHSGADFDSARPCWRVHIFLSVFMGLKEGVQKEERQRARDAFETFCLNTPWGALYHAVSPPPLRSAARMANRLASVLRFWNVLSDPDFLRERLSSLPLEDFEDFSSAYKYTVAVQLAAWDRALGRQ